MERDDEFQPLVMLHQRYTGQAQTVEELRYGDRWYREPQAILEAMGLSILERRQVQLLEVEQTFTNGDVIRGWERQTPQG